MIIVVYFGCRARGNAAPVFNGYAAGGVLQASVLGLAYTHNQVHACLTTGNGIAL
jgi:hypothetical protein